MIFGKFFERKPQNPSSEQKISDAQSFLDVSDSEFLLRYGVDRHTVLREANLEPVHGAETIPLYTEEFTNTNESEDSEAA